MNEVKDQSNQITEEELENAAKQAQEMPMTEQKPLENINAPQMPQATDEKSKGKGMGIFIILAILVLAAGLVFFIYQVIKQKQEIRFVPETQQETSTVPAVEQPKKPSEMTNDELFNDLDQDIDKTTADLDKDMDSVESGLDELSK